MSGPMKARVQDVPAYRDRRDRRDGVDGPATFPVLAAALGWVLDMLERYDRVVTASVSSSSPPWRTVRIIRVRDKELLLAASKYTGEPPDRKRVPDTAAVREVARLLPARGYCHVVLPEPQTPLATLGPLLSSRVLNCLLRDGYSSVEQVAVLPDAALHDMRSMGAIGIRELRAAIAGVGATPSVAAPVALTAGQAGQLARLLSALGALARTHDEDDLAEQVAAFARLLPDIPA
jgi:hypothetical protein